jgi:hypothetical protein
MPKAVMLSAAKHLRLLSRMHAPLGKMLRCAQHDKPGSSSEGKPNSRPAWQGHWYVVEDEGRRGNAAYA